MYAGAKTDEAGNAEQYLAYTAPHKLTTAEGQA